MSEENNVSVDGLRLRWVVKDESIRATIQVLEDALDPKSTQTPYENESGELHPISKLSISTVPLKQLSITLPDLENFIIYDECPEDHPDYTDEDGIPYDEPTCEVTASNGDFITIGDYISAVHPWLISLRDRYFEDAPIPGDNFHPDTELWVKPLSLISGIDLYHAEPHNISGNSDDDAWAYTAKLAGYLQHVKPPSGDSEDTTTSISEAQRADNIRNGFPEDCVQWARTDEEVLEIVRRAQKETGMDKYLWSGMQY